MKHSKSFRNIRRFSFTLKSIFAIFTTAAVALSLFAWRVERQERIVKWVVSQGGSVSYSDQFDSNGNYLGNVQLTFFARILGRDSVSSVRIVFLEDLELNDLGPLKGLSGVERLYLSSSSLRDYSALTSLRSLRSLTVSNVSEPNFTYIANMTWLEHLSLSNCSQDLESLGNLTNLKILKVSRGKTVDLEQISNLKRLERLDLEMVRVKSLNPLIKLENLRVVNLVDISIVEESDGVERIQKMIPGCEINRIILGPF